MRTISTQQAPAAIGPYSQAVIAQGFLYTSGQVALTPTGDFLRGTAVEEAQQVFANLDALLQASGCQRSDVVRVTVYLTDLGEFAAINEVYAAYFGEHRPARACVQVAALPKGAQVEIDLVAQVPTV
ncbi:MAG: RidA family protein [Planctomycetes bacterium]|nr:RidA family protein [Planctomycetota bacterium]